MKFDPGKSDVDRELRVMNSGVFGALRPLVVETVVALQRARTGQDFVALQRRLLEQFLRHQLTQEQTRERVKECKARRSSLTAKTPKPVSAIREISEEIKTDEFFDYVLGCALHALRCLGDGLAWKVVDFDRRAITVMGDGRRVGRLADDAGLQAELAELSRLWSREGRFAIHNDLTNCLRHGDLTIPTRLDGPRDVEVAEVKAGNKRKARQASRLNQKLAFLQAGYRPPADGNPAARILAPAPRLRTYHASLAEAIEQAHELGVADFAPHPCMTVAVADYRVLSESEDRPNDWASDAPRKRGWDRSDTRVIQSLALVRRLRERGDSFAFIAPYTIFPLKSEDIADLTLGYVDVCTTINCDELEHTLAAAGLSSEVAGGRDANSFFLRATDGANTVTLPAVVREQMLTELVRPETVVAAIRHSLADTAAHGSERPPQQLVPYAGERDIWLARLRGAAA